MLSTSSYRAALLEQLALVGDAAREMLLGTAAVDPVVVLAALEAAAVTRAPALLEAAHGSPLLPGILADLDLSPEGVDIDSGDIDGRGRADTDEAEARLHGLVSLALVASVVPSGLAAPLLDALDRSVVAVALEPERYGHLSALAAAIDAALALPPDHPASRLLGEVAGCAAVAAAPFPDAAFDRAAGRVLRPSWAAWLQARWAEAAAWLEPRIAAPIPAFADAGAPRAPTPRFVLADLDAGSLELLVRGGAAAIEWVPETDGAPLRVTLEPEGRQLEAAGAGQWWLGASPVATAWLRLHWADRGEDVQLAGR